MYCHVPYTDLNGMLCVVRCKHRLGFDDSWRNRFGVFGPFEVRIRRVRKWVVLKIGGPFPDPLIKVPYSILFWGPKRDPTLENYPRGEVWHQA